MNAWNSMRSGIKDKIRQLAKNGKTTDNWIEQLTELEKGKPVPPRVPRILRGDETPENLAWVLAKEWPSGGVISSEGGVVLGAHGMGHDSIMRNLGLLNILWDGGRLDIGRKSSDSFCVNGARLTMGIQVQEATLRNFFEKSGDLARGTGFLARFLIAWPTSTQGKRLFKEAPENWPAIEAYSSRLSDILNTPAPINEEGRLEPAMVCFSIDAKKAWIRFHDSIEEQLSDGGKYFDIRDVASKVADNAARVAGLFHIFEGIPGNAVTEETLLAACEITQWHLDEALRFFSELHIPEAKMNAEKLESWLLKRGRSQNTLAVPRNEIQKFGPNPLRKKEALSDALRELSELGRITELQDGRRLLIHINPKILDGIMSPPR